MDLDPRSVRSSDPGPGKIGVLIPFPVVYRIEQDALEVKHSRFTEFARKIPKIPDF